MNASKDDLKVGNMLAGRSLQIKETIEKKNKERGEGEMEHLIRISIAKKTTVREGLKRGHRGGGTGSRERGGKRDRAGTKTGGKIKENDPLRAVQSGHREVLGEGQVHV